MNDFNLTGRLPLIPLLTTFAVALLLDFIPLPADSFLDAAIQRKWCGFSDSAVHQRLVCLALSCWFAGGRQYPSPLGQHALFCVDDFLPFNCHKRKTG